MTQQLLLFFNTNTDVFPFTLLDNGKLVDSGEESLAELQARVAALDTYELTLVIPGEQVTSKKIAIPKGSRRHLQQALPYLLEEDLATPVENVHIASSNIDDEGMLLCTAIDRELLEHCLSVLAEQDFVPARAIPDYWLLPESDNIQIVEKGHRLIVRLPTNEGLVLPKETDEQVITRLFPELSEHGDLQFAQWHPEIVHNSAPLNFLQGDFAPTSKHTYTNLLKPLGIAATLCLAIFVAYFIAAGWHFNQQADQLHQQATAKYQSLFPNEKRIVNLRHQMQAHLNQSTANHSGSLFFELLQTFSTAKDKQTEPATVRNIRFDQSNSSLLLELQTASLSYANRIQKDIQSSGFSAEVLSANTNDEGAITRLRLTGGAR